MTTQHIETLIIGAGQAGLATGYHLQKLGRPFLIVDGGARVGDNWRQQWDTLRLYSPAKYDSLPGLPFPADRWHFPHKDEVADYLETYALTFDLPVRMSTRVDSLEGLPEGGYVAHLGADTITCDNVVVATGTFGRTPFVPDAAKKLDPSIRQLHSSEYRRPSQLKPGKVLVVGASHSGMDIAFELSQTHEAVLVGRDPGQIPVRLDKQAFKVVFPLMLFMGRHVITRRTPIGRHAMPEIRQHGGPALRVKRKDLADRGVERFESRFAGVRDGRPVLEDGTVVDATNVVWATGVRQAFDWIRLPILGEDGWPVEYRGVAKDAPGLYFAGLGFQYSFSSMLMAGAGRDAEYVACQLDKRSARRRLLATA